MALLDTSQQLIHTKLRPPFIRAGLVSRPRLQEQMAQGLRGPLTLVIAPAGFGKTTLAASFIVTCGMPVAWLSLDKDDNQEGRFLRYLVAALQEADNAIGNYGTQLMAASQQTPSEAVLTSLINDLDSASTEIALVLDDYQFINSQAVHEAVAFLLEHCPRPLKMVIASRSDPPLPLARLRARNEVAEIRADALRFIPLETSEFLNRVMGLDLNEEDIKSLESRTEGWIVGLQMAALSLQGRQDSSEFIRSFSGSHRYILEYLIEETLSRQPEELQSFLLHTSILERLCGPLCDAVIGRPSNSQEKLAQLDKSNLFIVPLDEAHYWYRYHHLFADLLRTQLQSSLNVQDIAQLHVRASDWHGRNGSIVEAIHHASLASDDERVERLIEQNYMELVSRGEMSWVRSWAGTLSKELVYRRPWLCLYEAYSHAWFGELDEAEALLELAERGARSETSAPDARAMLGQAGYIRSRVTAMRGDIQRAIELHLAAREYIPASNVALHLDSSVTLGYQYFLSGDYARARQHLDEAIRSGNTAGAVLTTVAAYCILARLQATRGLLNKSYELYHEAAQWVRESGRKHLGATSLIETGMADVLYEWNDMEAALVHVKQGIALIHLWAKVDDAALAYVTLARIRLAQTNRSDASEAVEKATHAIQTNGVFWEARTAVEAAQVRLWLAQGDLRAANRWAASLGERFDSDRRFGIENELTHINRARVLIARNTPHEAVGLLSQLEETARAAERAGRLIEILLLEAIVLQETGDPERAMLALTECLTLAGPEGYVRVFLNEGQPMQMLLAQWLARTNDSPLREYVIHLLSQFDGDLQVVTAVQQEALSAGDLVEPLTPRELEVLQLICAGDSNQVVAGKLVITVSTVKKHMGNILGKLGVTSRAQAMVKARQLGLLPKDN